MSERTGRQRHAAMPVSPPRTRGAQAAGVMGMAMDLAKHALAGPLVPPRMRGWGRNPIPGTGLLAPVRFLNASYTIRLSESLGEILGVKACCLR